MHLTTDQISLTEELVRFQEKRAKFLSQPVRRIRKRLICHRIRELAGDVLTPDRPPDARRNTHAEWQGLSRRCVG